MNHDRAQIAAEPTSRAKAAIAALLALFLVIAGALTAPPATAVEGPVLTGTVTATSSGLSVAVAGSGFGEVAATYVAVIEKGAETALGQSDPAIEAHLTAGAFEGTLARAASALDRTKQYEVIAWQTRSNPSAETIYARSDLTITSGQWDVVFPPAPVTQTTTVLSTSPTETAAAGTTVTLTATVAPTAPGTVAFFAGEASLGSAPVSGSTATVSTATLAVGSHSLTAVFTPTDAGAFAASTSAALSFAVTAATPQPTPATVTVSKSTGLDRDGETITVTGSGFIANPPATTGTRPPLAGVFGGSYVVFGKFPDSWKPSDGIPSSARKVLVQKWGVHAAQFGGAVNEAGGGFVLPADGSFTIDIAVSASEANDALAGNYGIYTFPGSGATYAPFETYTPLSFADPAPVFDPAIEVFLADGVTPLGDAKVYEGAKLVVKGTGFDPAANVGGMGQPIPASLPQGTFVVFGSFADDWKPSAGNGGATRVMDNAARQWALAESVLTQVPEPNQATIRGAWTPIAADGSFTATVTVKAPASPLADGNWGVYTYPGGVGTPANPAQELSVPVDYAGVATEPEPETGAKITVSPTAGLDHTVENVLTVTGTGFSRSVFVAIAPTEFWDGTQPRPFDGWLTLTGAWPNADGAITGKLTLPPFSLKPGTSYSVSTAVISGAPDPAQVAFAPVAVATPEAPVDVALSATSVVTGEQVTVSGSGFVPNAPATSGTRPPLLAQFAGAYVQFGYYSGSTWTALSRGVDHTKWAVSAADVDSVGGAEQGGIALGADGTFTTTVKADAAAAAPTGARYGVRTFAGGGATYSSFSTFTEVTLLPRPATVVDATTGVVAGQQIAVSGSGFLANAPATDGTRQPLLEKFGGAYVQFGYYSGSTWTALSRDVDHTKWVVEAADVDAIGGPAAGAVALGAGGTFATTLTAAKASAAPADARYGVRTFAGGGSTYAPFSTFTEIAFATTPTVIVSQTSDVVDGATLTVTGSNFEANAPATDGTRQPLLEKFGGAYVQFGYYSGSTWTALSRGVEHTKWAVDAADLDAIGGTPAGGVAIGAGGTFTTTLTAAKASAAPADARYGVRTFAGGGSTYAPFSTFTEVAFHVPVVKTIAVTVPTVTADAATVRVVGSNFGDVTGAYAAVIEKGTESQLSASGGYVVFGYWMTPGAIVGGAFDKALVAPADKLDREKEYEVVVWQGHSAPDATTIYARADVNLTDAQWDVLKPQVVEQKTIAVTVPTVTADAATVRVVGSNFGDVTGAYAAVIEKGTESQLSASGGYVVFGYWMTPGAIVGGAFDKALVAPADKLDREKEYEVVVWQGHSAPDATTIYARADVNLTDEQWRILHPGTTPPVDPQPPVDPETPATPPTVAGGSLRWAVSPTFNTYIVGPIANGSITVSGGATRADGLFQFGQAAGSTYDAASGTGTVSYVGSVRYYGHAGVLDVTVASPQIRVTSATSATLYVTSGGTQVAFATLNLAAGAKTTANGAVTYANVPATLTQAGLNQVLGGYSTGLGPVTFTIGSPAAAPAGSSGNVASAPRAEQTPTIPATPPTAEGIELDEATLAALQSGQPVSVSVSGFTPNEQGIRVVVYSTPVLLDTVTADASGTATWSGSLPATLADGEHTLTFQGSVDRGIRFVLDRSATTAVIGACVVDGASLNWGFKESFRTYIEGIAAGGWTLADVAYEFPEFVWAGGAGSLDVDTRTGLVTYGGSIRFEGHSGALDTTLSNFRLELAGDVGYIVVDVAGTTQSGEAVSQTDIRFAEFALPDLEITDEGLVLDALPATLTDAGATAFGTYAAGEELDAVSAVIPVDVACGEPVAAPAEEEPRAEVETTSIEPISEGSPVWPWAVGGLAVLVAIGAVTWVVVSRRRAAAAAGSDEHTA